MKISQRRGEHSLALLCILFLVVIDFEYVLAKRKLKDGEDTNSLAIAERKAHEEKLPEQHSLIVADKTQPKRGKAVRAGNAENPRSFRGGGYHLMFNDKSHLQSEEESNPHPKVSGPAFTRKFRSKVARAKKKRQKKKIIKNLLLALAGKPRRTRHSGSESADRGRRIGRKRAIEHLPDALESLRRLGNDLNILGNELMGFHFPSYLRVLMYVFSLIL